MVKKKFTDEELKELYSQGLNDREMAEELGAHHTTVEQRRRALGLSPNGETESTKKFTDEELKELHSKGMNDKELAEELGAHHTTVRQRRKALGLSPNAKVGNKKFTDKELKELYDKGLNDREMAEELGVCPATVCQRRNKLGLKSKHRKPFSSGEEKKIEEMNKEGISDNKIAKELGRNQAVITQKRKRMELESSHPSPSEGIYKGDIIEYIENNSPVKRRTVTEEFGVDNRPVMRAVRDENLNRTRLTGRTVDGIGSPKVYGKLAGHTLLYADEDESEVKRMVLEEAENRKQARRCCSIFSSPARSISGGKDKDRKTRGLAGFEEVEPSSTRKRIKSGIISVNKYYISIPRWLREKHDGFEYGDYMRVMVDSPGKRILLQPSEDKDGFELKGNEQSPNIPCSNAMDRVEVKNEKVKRVPCEWDDELGGLVIQLG